MRLEPFQIDDDEHLHSEYLLRVEAEHATGAGGLYVRASEYGAEQMADAYLTRMEARKLRDWLNTYLQED